MVGIVFTMLKEIMMSIALRITFKAVAERFMTRLVIYGLEKLKGYSTNDVLQGTVDDIISQLRNKRLYVADTYVSEETSINA